MPFRNLSSEPDTEYFANGFVEDLPTDLTRFSSLRVLVAQSALGLQLIDQSAHHVAGEWGLDFILLGTIRRGKRRAARRCPDPPGGEIVWADRIDAPLESVEGDYGYIVWTAETADNVYGLGTDTFVARDDKIVIQSFAGQITPKR